MSIEPIIVTEDVVVETPPITVTETPTPSEPVDVIQPNKISALVEGFSKVFSALDQLTGSALSADKAYMPTSRDSTDPLKVHRGLLLVYPKFATLASTDGLTSYILDDENAARRLMGSKYLIEELKDTEGINARTKEVKAISGIKLMISEIHEKLATLESLKDATASAESLQKWLITPEVVLDAPIVITEPES